VLYGGIPLVLIIAGYLFISNFQIGIFRRELPDQVQDMMLRQGKWSLPRTRQKELSIRE